MHIGCTQLAILFLFFNPIAAESYAAVPRWGQATALINNILYVHGGKTDEFNAFGYYNAPTNNDLLALSFAENYNTSSPPWQIISSASNTSASQGPSVAWHSLSGFTTTDALAFGGIPATSSPDVLTSLPDSAWTLNVESPGGPQWTRQEDSWASEPVRRVHHSTVSARDGQIYVFGGEKADGSGTVFSEHLRFNGENAFDRLPTDNGPPAITGHTSVLNSRGNILVFGGVSEGSLLPLSTVWSIDSRAANATWNILNCSTDSLPTPRRAFAATSAGSKVIIHGGTDAAMQSTYSDGWILDPTVTPCVWSPVNALGQLGARKDHFAVESGNSIVFGFGFGESGPSPAQLQIYDTIGSSMVSSFTAVPTVSLTRTLPTPTTVKTGTSGQTTTRGSGPASSSSVPGGDDNGGNPQNADKTQNKRTTAIAVGAAFGILGFLAGGIVILVIIRRKRRQAYFMALHNVGDDPDSPESPNTPRHNLPLAGSHEKGTGQHGWDTLRAEGVSGIVALLVPGRRRAPQRRDILADEDTREFEQWQDVRRRPGLGGGAFGGSSWSLKSILTRVRTREPSGASTRGSTPWLEKGDPFSDGAALTADAETGFIGASVPGASRPRAKRDMSYSSSVSGYSYVDPFADPIQEHDEDEHTSLNAGPSRPSPYPQHPLHLDTLIPMRTVPHTLSPVTESSRNTISLREGTSVSSLGTGSHERGISPFDVLSTHTSNTSYDPTRSPRPSSIIDGVGLSTSAPIRRSDSWWNRFARTSLLERRASERASRGGAFEFKDPHPPPARLTAIEESQNSGSPEDSPGSRQSSIRRSLSKLSKQGSRVYGGHGKSMSSLRTADSDALERMGDNMEVVQHLRSRSNRLRDSTGSMSIDTRSEVGSWLPDEDDRSMPVSSPTEGFPFDTAAKSPRTTPPGDAQTPPSAALSLASQDSSGSGGSVAARIKDYERRMSQDVSPSLKNTREREERPRRTSQVVGYGLAPRQSLFVANPDHRHGASGSSA